MRLTTSEKRFLSLICQSIFGSQMNWRPLRGVGPRVDTRSLMSALYWARAWALVARVLAPYRRVLKVPMVDVALHGELELGALQDGVANTVLGFCAIAVPGKLRSKKSNARKKNSLSLMIGPPTLPPVILRTSVGL